MKSIGSQLFAVGSVGQASPRPIYERITARDLGLQETWFRDAIFSNPELVIAPCRAAGRVDAGEVWLPWRVEANFGSGPIDVLLVSSYGRIGIVETKLSYNPQKRREVVAQVLDYALSLQDVERDELPTLPDSEFVPDEIDLSDGLASGKFLLIIAGDALDPRALRLSQSLLARHLTNEWDLVMIDLNVFRSTESEQSLLMVPELLGTVQADLRQVVRVQIQGESPKARVSVERISQDIPSVARPPKLASIEAFSAQVETEAPLLAGAVRALVDAFSGASTSSPGVIRFGLQASTANLYWVSPSGQQRRFLTVTTDGRVRVIFRYLASTGHEDLVARLKEISQTLFVIGAQERSGTVWVSERNVAELVVFIGQVSELLRKNS